MEEYQMFSGIKHDPLILKSRKILSVTNYVLRGKNEGKSKA